MRVCITKTRYCTNNVPQLKYRCYVSGPLGSNTLGEVPEDKYEFDEGAAQVQRLLQRDRKELTGIEEIGAGFRTEFDEGPSDKKEEEEKPSTSGRSNGSTPPAGLSASEWCM